MGQWLGDKCPSDPPAPRWMVLTVIAITDSRCTAPMWFKKGYIIPNVRLESGFPCVLDNLTSEHAAAVGWLRRAHHPLTAVYKDCAAYELLCCIGTIGRFPTRKTLWANRLGEGASFRHCSQPLLLHGSQGLHVQTLRGGMANATVAGRPGSRRPSSRPVPHGTADRYRSRKGSPEGPQRRSRGKR